MSTEQRPGSTLLPKRVQRSITGIHTFLYRLSGGKLGGRFGKSPVLLLTTKGRKTGKVRTSPLLYLKDGEDVVLVASYGGSPTHPLWWLNLKANPQAQIEIGRQKMTVIARQVDAQERTRLWPLLVAMYPEYAAYQKKTTREIPVVLLHPEASEKSV